MKIFLTKILFVLLFLISTSSCRRVIHTIREDDTPTSSVLFVGGNEARHKELNALKTAASEFNFNVLSVCADNEADDLKNHKFVLPSGEIIILLATNETGQTKFLRHLIDDIGLDATKAQESIGFINSILYPPSVEGTDQIAHTSLSEFAHWIVYLAEAETGKRTIDRLVISAHGHAFGFFGEIIGSVSVGDLGNLYRIFSTAALQVKHLMTSACQSGMRAVQEGYQTFLPNIQSVMGYTGSSPSTASGATYHIQEWGKFTRPGFTGTFNRAEIIKAIKRIPRAKWSSYNNIALWTKEGGYEAKRRTAQEVDLYSTWKNIHEPVFTQYYECSANKDPENSARSSEMLRLYTFANSLASDLYLENSDVKGQVKSEFETFYCEGEEEHADDPEWCNDGDRWQVREDTEGFNARVEELLETPRQLLALRFYHVVKVNLASGFSQKLAAYDLIDLHSHIESFTSLKRPALLAEIELVENKLGFMVLNPSFEPDWPIQLAKVQELLELLVGLRELSKNFIPMRNLETWIATGH